MDQQGQGYLYPGLPIRIAGHATNFQPQNFRTTAAAAGPAPSPSPSGGSNNNNNNANPENHYLQERREGGAFIYGTVQYNAVHHHHHHHPNSNFYPPFVPVSQLPPPSGGFGDHHHYHYHHNNLNSNHSLMAGGGGPSKSKVVPHESGVLGSNSFPQQQHFNAPSNGVSVPDPASSSSSSFSVPHYNNNHRGFAGPHFQPSGMWLEQQHVGSSSGEGTALAWNQPHCIPFMHVPMETAANIGIPRQNMRHAPPVGHRHPHQAHHASPIVPRPREQHNNNNNNNNNNSNNNNLTATPTPTPHRSSSNSSRVNRGLAQNGSETTGHRHSGGAVQPTGIRIYRPHREAGSDAPSRSQQLARLRYLRADEVAILEIPDYYELSDYSDHHGDMRLDIEDMSYEELLALGERIGNVNTGLSEEAITGQLKTVSYLSHENSDMEAQCCIICQDNYKNMEKIGVLGCGHEYHAECLKKWLVIKNVCPICKSEALSSRNMEKGF